jgi:hypothetical protein
VTGASLNPRVAARMVPALVAARAVVPWAVRTVSLPALLDRASLKVDEPPVPFADAVAVIEALEAWWRRLPRGTGTCLTRSLWRAIALRRGGIAVDFVLGVRADAAGRPEGHAWLEIAGAPVLERNPAHLVRFQRAWTHAAGRPLPSEPAGTQVEAVPVARWPR